VNRRTPESKNRIKTIGKLKRAIEATHRKRAVGTMKARMSQNKDRKMINPCPTTETMQNADSIVTELSGNDMRNIVDDNDRTAIVDKSILHLIQNAVDRRNAAEIGIIIKVDKTQVVGERDRAAVDRIRITAARLMVEILEIKIQDTAASKSNVGSNLLSQQSLADIRVTKKASHLALKPQVVPQTDRQRSVVANLLISAKAENAVGAIAMMPLRVLASLTSDCITKRLSYIAAL
jgi:hypothetical protein